MVPKHKKQKKQKRLVEEEKEEEEPRYRNAQYDALLQCLEQQINIDVSVQKAKKGSNQHKKLVDLAADAATETTAALDDFVYRPRSTAPKSMGQRDREVNLTQSERALQYALFEEICQTLRKEADKKEDNGIHEKLSESVLSRYCQQFQRDTYEEPWFPKKYRPVDYSQDFVGQDFLDSRDDNLKATPDIQPLIDQREIKELPPLPPPMTNEQFKLKKAAEKAEAEARKQLAARNAAKREAAEEAFRKLQEKYAAFREEQDEDDDEDEEEDDDEDEEEDDDEDEEEEDDDEDEEEEEDDEDEEEEEDDEDEDDEDEDDEDAEELGAEDDAESGEDAKRLLMQTMCN